jgi:hypothetical protein
MIYFYSKTKEMHLFLKFILFCSTSCTLNVLDGLSVECSSISFPLASSQQNLFDIYLMPYVQSQTPDDGRKVRPNHVEC